MIKKLFFINKNIILKLLNKNPYERIGKNGFDEVKNHA